MDRYRDYNRCEAFDVLSQINSYMLKNKTSGLNQGQKERFHELCEELEYCGGYWKDYARNLSKAIYVK